PPAELLLVQLPGLRAASRGDRSRETGAGPVRPRCLQLAGAGRHSGCAQSAGRAADRLHRSAGPRRLAVLFGLWRQHRHDLGPDETAAHIVIDKSAHMSILEGAQLARSKVHYFEHNDIDHLAEILKEIAPEASRILVCTEGVFSADGDFGALDRIVPLAKSYGAQVLVDEAHSFLLCGPHGRGAAEQQGVLDQVDYLVVTFSKALG